MEQVDSALIGGPHRSFQTSSVSASGENWLWRIFRDGHGQARCFAVPNRVHTPGLTRYVLRVAVSSHIQPKIETLPSRYLRQSQFSADVDTADSVSGQVIRNVVIPMLAAHCRHNLRRRV